MPEWPNGVEEIPKLKASGKGLSLSTCFIGRRDIYWLSAYVGSNPTPRIYLLRWKTQKTEFVAQKHEKLEYNLNSIEEKSNGHESISISYLSISCSL